MHLSSRSKVNGAAAKLRRRCGQKGAVLLEVVLALVLFVAAAAVLTSGLSSSLDGVERLRLQAHAADMAVSVFSELQMGIKSLALSGPQPFDPPVEGWTWEAVATPLQMQQTESEEATPFKRIEVIVRHDAPAVVYRMSQVLQIDPNQAAKEQRLPGVSSF
jgi:hypothetical protein